MEGEAPVKPGISVSALGQRLEQVLLPWLVHMHLAWLPTSRSWNRVRSHRAWPQRRDGEVTDTSWVLYTWKMARQSLGTEWQLPWLFWWWLCYRTREENLNKGIEAIVFVRGIHDTSKRATSLLFMNCNVSPGRDPLFRLSLGDFAHGRL